MMLEIPTEAVAPVTNNRAINQPYLLGHGTLECRDIAETRCFYEEFLGLETVRHAAPAFAFRLGLKFHVFCVEVGDKIHDVSFLTHWGLDVRSREEVEAAYRAAHEHKDRYKIRQITEVTLQHGVYSFYLQDLDYNWWEFQYYEGFQDDDIFDFGDRF
ncbi:VOC family protein [Burkholderia gladioli]|uniref:VOC family protein n=1 Tax=Burkholderia gladioli TaxID=28095 RepID=A0A2A7S9Y8_BURGA|nr:glyoxalase/bleomycin resistance/dioxygenase family protein [Burkholderia gladioli pv. gladioli]AWY56894.1 glyoxalase/bleomycin resistance/dioxygenase family protein [Burkholderia gladioli pv. gladioli]PEH40219.1 VOC family protein [Burkholderia gladioli]QPQ85342.1 VOC family protein [Burkholderia gladioli]